MLKLYSPSKQVLPVFTLLLLFALPLTLVFAAPVELDSNICGEYVYDLPKGYKATSESMKYGSKSIFVNYLPVPRTSEDSNTPSVHCILEENAGDFSYRFAQKERIRFMSLTKMDRMLDTAGQCGEDFEKYKLYLLSEKKMNPNGKAFLSHRIAIEINEEGNAFDTVFVLNALDMAYPSLYPWPTDIQIEEINDQTAKELCTRAKLFISTIKRR